MLLSKEEFQTELQYWTEVAGELFVESEGELNPHLVVLVNNGASYGRKGQPVVAAFLICEAWRSRWPVGQKATVAPVDDPNHDEILVVSGITVELHHGSATAQILHEDGKRQLGAFDTWESDTSNRLLALFLMGFSQAFIGHMARLN